MGEKNGVVVPGVSRDLEQLSRETPVVPRPVSEEFIQALRQAAARSSLVHSLEVQRERRAGRSR
jgi:hypothetical protein